MPLVVVAPSIAAGTRADTASLVDVAPTVRAAVGLEPMGVDLRHPVPESRIAMSYGTIYRQVQCSARDRDRRLIVDLCDPSEGARVYDLHADPGEHHATAPRPSDPLLRAVSGLRSPDARGAAATNTAALEALGYVDR